MTNASYFCLRDIKKVLDFCPLIAYTNYSMTKKRTHIEYEQLLMQKESSSIPLEDYKGARIPILHICIACDYEWKIKPDHVLSGHGCPRCANNRSTLGDYGDDTQTKLYYIKITKDNVIAYKLGITKLRIRDRFQGEKSDKRIDIIRLWYFNTREEALKEEQRLLRFFNKSRYKSKPLLKRGGNSELFTYDILNLDKGINQNGLGRCR